MSHIDEILDFVIAGEEEAAAFYRALAMDADTPWLKELLLSFAQEEDGHRAKLLAVKGGARLRPAGAPVIDLKIADYLVDVQPGPNMSFQDILVIAMKREKAAFKLYTDLAARAGDAEVEATFLSLAQEEAKHKLRFEIEYDERVLQEN
ncbi:MAG: ferritin family protein [Pseudomonadota bacterium]